jgi:hypothetical protein
VTGTAKKLAYLAAPLSDDGIEIVDGVVTGTGLVANACVVGRSADDATS